jgi:hypothetical protein
VEYAISLPKRVIAVYPDGLEILPPGLALSLLATQGIVAEKNPEKLEGHGLGRPLEKAGGYVAYSALEKYAPGARPEDFSLGRLKESRDSYNLIYPGNNLADLRSAPLYQKKRLVLGFVKTTALGPAGYPIGFRPLEGDVVATVAKDVFS